jgi:signal peptidase
MLGKRTGNFKVPNELKYVLIAVVAVALIWLGIRLVFGVSNPFYVVASDSMVPKLNIGDLLLIQHSNNPSSSSAFNSLKIGNIIVFQSPFPLPDTGDREIIVHRVAGIYKTISDGQRIIRTKGDANPESIPGIDYPIAEKNYIGRVVLILPGVGLITKTISPPVNYVLIVIILVILFFLLRKRRQEQRKEGQKLE